MCGRCEMIYPDAHVGIGQSCSGQLSVVSVQSCVLEFQSGHREEAAGWMRLVKKVKTYGQNLNVTQRGQ